MRSIILLTLLLTIVLLVEARRGGGGRRGNGEEEEFGGRNGNGGRFGRRPGGQTRQLERSIEGLIRQLDAQQTRFANNTAITSSIASVTPQLTQLLGLLRNNTSTPTTTTAAS